MITNASDLALELKAQKLPVPHHLAPCDDGWMLNWVAKGYWISVGWYQSEKAFGEWYIGVSQIDQTHAIRMIQDHEQAGTL